jgi:hypothetical protein
MKQKTFADMQALDSASTALHDTVVAKFVEEQQEVWRKDPKAAYWVLMHTLPGMARLAVMSFCPPGDDNFVQVLKDHIKLCMDDPDAHLNDPLTPITALWYYENGFAAHQCYWNDRFCIAVACNMPLRYKQEAAEAIVGNGRSGYFEWRTHYGYNMVRVFKQLGIATLPTPGCHESTFELSPRSST